MSLILTGEASAETATGDGAESGEAVEKEGGEGGEESAADKAKKAAREAAKKQAKKKKKTIKVTKTKTVTDKKRAKLEVVSSYRVRRTCASCFSIPLCVLCYRDRQLFCVLIIIHLLCPSFLLLLHASFGSCVM